MDNGSFLFLLEHFLQISRRFSILTVLLDKILNLLEHF